jgi:prephenate dehydrogenase
MFRQITIVGVGLIGGSFALALKKHGYRGTIVGCDREAVLQRALEKGVVDRGVLHPEEAIAGSDLVLLAAPVGAWPNVLSRGIPWPARRTAAWSLPMPRCSKTQSGF